MYIYLMRHGKTEWNVLRRMQGRSDIPLNENGHAQAHRAAEAMADIPFDLIVCSPLVRTQETALAVAKGRDVDIVVDELLIEMGFGDLEGLVLRENPRCQLIFNEPEHYIPSGGGESYAELDERCRRVIENIILPLERNFSHVLLVTHGALIKGILRRLKGDSLANFWKTPPQKNCSCTVLECSNGTLTIVEEGRTYE